MIGKQEREFYMSIKDELNIVFDVGCRNDNIFFDIKPELEIHLFDPRKPAVKMYGNFNNYALGERIGKGKYYHEYSSFYKRIELTGEKWEHLRHDFTIVKIDTLDNYCQTNNIIKIDLLKIDAEGYDYNVLLGGLKMLKNIKYIQFEHWNEEKTKSIKELLQEFTIKELGGKPMNYIAIKS